MQFWFHFEGELAPLPAQSRSKTWDTQDMKAARTADFHFSLHLNGLKQPPRSSVAATLHLENRSLANFFCTCAWFWAKTE